MKKRINTNSAARAVIYARYSSANQRDCSIEQQVEKCRELAARDGVTVIEIYADRAISGKTGWILRLNARRRQARCRTA